MDLGTITTAHLQARNVEILQSVERITQGEDIGTSYAALYQEKRALQAELRRRGDPIKAEANKPTSQGNALAQHLTNADAADLLRENLLLKAELAKAGVK